MPTLYIDLSENNPIAKIGVNNANAASLSAILGNTLSVPVAFVRAGAVVALADGSTGKLVVKQHGQQSGPVVLLDSEWTSNGSAGTARRYTFSLVADSEAARTALAAIDSPRTALALSASIEWTESGTESRCLDFPFLLHNSSSRGEEDEAPDPVSSSAWAWLKARLVAGTNVTFTDNDTAKTRTIAASGGGTVDAPAIAAIIHAGTSKTTPADNDELPLSDSAASWAFKKLTWANLKEALKSYLDSFHSAIGHTHGQDAITNLVSDLAAKADASALADKADNTALNSHTENTSNPHSVTAAQLGTLRVQRVTGNASYYQVLAADGTVDGYILRVTTLEE